MSRGAEERRLGEGGVEIEGDVSTPTDCAVRAELKIWWAFDGDFHSLTNPRRGTWAKFSIFPNLRDWDRWDLWDTQSEGKLGGMGLIPKKKTKTKTNCIPKCQKQEKIITNFSITWIYFWQNYSYLFNYYFNKCNHITRKKYDCIETSAST